MGVDAPVVGFEHRINTSIHIFIHYTATSKLRVHSAGSNISVIMSCVKHSPNKVQTPSCVDFWQKRGNNLPQLSPFFFLLSMHFNL